MKKNLKIMTCSWKVQFTHLPLDSLKPIPDFRGLFCPSYIFCLFENKIEIWKILQIIRLNRKETFSKDLTLEERKRMKIALSFLHALFTLCSQYCNISIWNWNYIWLYNILTFLCYEKSHIFC